MGLDIWFREDITNALKAAEQASATTVAAMEYALNGSSPSTTLRRCTEPAEGPVVSDPRYLRAYREGWRAALVTIALAFGLKSDGSEGCYGQDKLLR